MRKFDIFVGSSLVVLAAFVGRETLRTRAHLREMEQRAVTSAPVVVDATIESGEFLPGPTDESLPEVGVPPAIADVRRRLELSSDGTYIDEVISAHDSALVRWPERSVEPLRVWVQPTANLVAFRGEFVPVVRRAFNAWSAVGIPVSFTFLADSAGADIHVTWTDRFQDAISGRTVWSHDEAMWILDARVQLAVRHQSGEPLDSTAVAAIARHEVGHLLGLDHTADTTSVMAPKVRVRDLSPADRATIQLLYRLPAGRIGTGPTS